ncbi:hypothetical protein SLEP1_g15285 [Rubroshorea leprosula]|uniref:RNase H type-1 domain-containing protein n=1 Tax=Rubroshorea leprosula TaxID=152421 RepID=A0AAV5IVY4_9ROSI|nr:hypothetical protein SLEP1_g15285 [Rubroshorea leprosula]
MLVELKVSMVEVIWDSQLILKQLSGEYKCTNLTLAPYFALAVQLLKEFDDVSLRHVPKDQNYEANEMAQLALGLRIPEGEAMMNYCCVVWVQIKVSRCCLTSMMGFLVHTSLHYAQAEASNKVLINLLERMVDNKIRCWHERLFETLWAYRTSQRSSTKMTPFALTYGHDAVLPMELTARSSRIAIQHNLQSGEYDEGMMLELENLEDTRLIALDRLQVQKLKNSKLQSFTTRE